MPTYLKRQKTYNIPAAHLMCINEGSSATDYTLIGEFKPLLISRFVLKNDLMAPDVLM